MPKKATFLLTLTPILMLAEMLLQDPIISTPVEKDPARLSLALASAIDDNSHSTSSVEASELPSSKSRNKLDHIALLPKAG